MPRASTLRILRLAALAIIVLVVIFKFAKPSSLTALSHAAGYHDKSSAKAATASTEVKADEAKVQQPPAEVEKVKEDVATPDVVPAASAMTSGAEYVRANATFVTLARNEDIWSLVKSIRHIEDRFNHQFHYDWVFLNDGDFDETFKEVTSALVSGTVKYGKIPKEHWGYPEWIDQEKAAFTREEMRKKQIIYGDSVSYRHMCRFESGFFFDHELMQDYKYYWRVEPDIIIHCDVSYDVFKFVEEKGYDYGFTLSLYEYIETIPTLWDSVKKFIKEHPEHIAENNLMNWISDDNGVTYNKCHFWSNFEIGNLDFWRSKAYRDFFTFLDHEGGFFYERWGDAPVHSIAAALFLPQEKVHFFDDIGYWHVPFTSCPTNKEDRLKLKCSCNARENFVWKGYSCTPRYYDVTQKKRPSEWHEQS